jgi:hypothetical protein
MSEIKVELPTKEQFSEQLNSTFRANLDDGQVIDLQFFKLESTISNPVQEAFSLMFRAPVDAPPFQNMFRLEHEKLGAMELFLVPVKKKDDGLYYEAVFNRLLV